jgi:hypothetical protein
MTRNPNCRGFSFAYDEEQTMKIEIEKLHAGYRLVNWTHRSFVVTAQDLLTIMDYALLHANELRQEAKENAERDRQSKGVRDEDNKT